jgi:hypothetical protein
LLLLCDKKIKFGVCGAFTRRVLPGALEKGRTVCAGQDTSFLAYHDFKKTGSSEFL